MDVFKANTCIEVPDTINPLISSNIIQFIDNEFKLKLQNISDDYEIDYEELKENYSLDLSKLAVKLGMKKRNRRILNSNEQCMGRKIDGNRCTRSKRDKSDYCISNQKGLPQGRIDDDVFENLMKSKNLKKKKTNELENNKDYLAVTVENINGQSWLVNPQTREVYTYDLEQPKRVGILSDDRNIVYN